MKRRYRRRLFNLFAFSLLGIAVYLNLYRMHDEQPVSRYNTSKSVVKANPVIISLSKIPGKEVHQN